LNMEKKPESLQNLLPAVAAEFVGSVFFILIGCGSAMSTAAKFTNPGPIVIGISLSFGFTLFALGFAIGHISGGHLNCALTLAFVVTGKISWLRGVLYFFAQLSGGLVGGALLVALMPSIYQSDCFAANVLGDEVSVGQGLGWEIMLTFFFLFVVGAASDTFKSNTVMVPLAIGMAVTVCHFVAIPITGTSLNPTRSFASAVASTHVSGDACSYVWDDHWIFWVGPCVGAIFGLVTYEYISFAALGPHTHKAQDLSKMYRQQQPGAPQGSSGLSLGEEPVNG